MKDRFTAGALAGIAGAVIQDLYSFIIESQGIANRSFSDFGRIMVMLKPYGGTLASIVGFISHITVGILFGILFAYIILKTSDKYYLTKGFIYGLALWFLLLGFGTMWRLPMWTNVPPPTSLAILIGSIIYGLVTAYTLKLLERRTKLL
ncbi:DUF6789 family protein [Desulfolucanica intricata]|uniref:DUF6789 family protein n=1 Tax=Desulfolucanica intricata TaxID=1285191 RepID=UPI00082CB840|nr:DUF6789 family protein [Desulfolucanica intricata]